MSLPTDRATDRPAARLILRAMARRDGSLHRLLRPALLAVLTLTSVLNAEADAYKCRLPDGSIEIVSRPCATGSATLSVQNEEKIPENRRREAEEEVRRLRSQIERRESAQRDGPTRDTQTNGAPPASITSSDAPPPAAPKRTLEECLRELDRHALEPTQRLNLESACRSNPETQLVFVPVPVYTAPPHVGQRPAIQFVPGTPNVPAPPSKPAAKPVPAQEAPSSVCPPNNKFCR